MLRVLVYDTSIGGVMLRQGRASNLWLYVFGHLVFWPTVLEEGCIVLSDTWIVPLQALLLFIWMMCLWAPPDLHAWLRIFIATAWKTAMMYC